MHKLYNMFIEKVCSNENINQYSKQLQLPICDYQVFSTFPCVGSIKVILALVD